MIDFKKEHLFEFETHPFGGHLNELTRTLVIGTFPSHAKNADLRFFYGGKDNRFWTLLAIIYDEQFKRTTGDAAVRERRVLLDKYHIGITDMIASCYRYDGRSGDEHLFPVELNDILTILDRYPAINRLVFTSRTFAIGALGLFRTYLRAKGHILEELDRDGEFLLKRHFLYSERSVSIQVPFSPSKRVEAEGRADLDDMILMYRQAFRGE